MLRQLKELTLDGNPVLSSEDCILFVIAYIPSVQIFGQTKISDDIRKVSKIWRLRREFNEKPSASFENDKLELPADGDPKRIRSASENRVVQFRKCIGDSKSKESKLIGKDSNRTGSCSAKPVRVLDRNAKMRRANYMKGKTISTDSCYGSETSVEYFRLPPILTSSLNSMDDCNVVLRNDPNTSMESNKSCCSIRCESVSSVDKSEESSSSSEAESESTVEKEVPNVCTDIVPAIRTNPTAILEKERIAERSVFREQQLVEAKAPRISDIKVKQQKANIPAEKTKEQGEADSFS